MLERIWTLLVELETTYGTDPTPVAGDAVSVTDLKVDISGDKLDKSAGGDGSLSSVAHVIGHKWVDISFSVYGRGSGALGTAPEISALLRACALLETVNASTSVVYTPRSTGFESCTIYAYLDGMIQKITGCRGTVDIVFEAGQFVKFNFKMSGLYAVPVDGAVIAGTYDETIPPIVAGSGFTHGSYSAIISNLSVALNNVVAKTKHVNSALGKIDITGRDITGSFDPDAVTEATHPFWADWAAGTARAMTMTVGGTNGNKIKIDIAAAQSDSIAWGAREGIRTYDIPFSCRRSAATGDDEVTLTFI